MSNTSCKVSISEKECKGNRYNINMLFLIIFFILVVKGVDINVIPYEIMNNLDINKFFSEFLKF